MLEKFRNILYAIDLISIKPELYIFKDNKYKSLLSSILSFLILLCSIAFGLYSLIEYLKYNSPNVVYSKANDLTTKRVINLKDIFLMFQIVENANFYNNIDKSIAYYEAEYYSYYYNRTYSVIPLEISNCESGNYIDENLINLIKLNDREVEDFYCIKPKRDDLELFYFPNVGFGNLNIYTKINKNDKYTPEQIQSLIVSENDLIDHYDKENTITKNYAHHLTRGYSSSEYTNIDYNIQFIRYETDDGPIFKNSKIEKGISFSDITFSKNRNYFDLKKDFENYNSSRIGIITIEINQSYFDNYKRTYERLQGLLAEIMSVVNLLLQIGNIISNFLCKKRMCKDIMNNLLNNQKIQRINKK